MLIGQKGVKYGLTVPKQKAKPAASAAKKKSVFGEEDSDEDAQASVEQQIARQAARKQTDKKVADIHAAALAEDAAIFDYDAHYDDIQAARVEPKRQEKVQRESKYITSLLEKAEERKREQSILYERQLAKERAAEDHLFGDKERFVTAAYRKKLEEDRKWLEEEKRKKESEEREAVEKKGHMGDFYRNLFRSNVAFGAKPGEKPKQQKEPEAEQPRSPSEGGAEPGPAEAAAAAAAAPNGGLGESPEASGKAAVPAASNRQEAGPAAGRDGAREQPGRTSDAEAQQAKQALQKRAPVGEPAGGGPEAEAAVTIQQQQQQQAAAEAEQRRNREDAVAAARERYLARKRKAVQE